MCQIVLYQWTNVYLGSLISIRLVGCNRSNFAQSILSFSGSILIDSSFYRSIRSMPRHRRTKGVRQCLHLVLSYFLPMYRNNFTEVEKVGSADLRLSANHYFTVKMRLSIEERTPSTPSLSWLTDQHRAATTAAGSTRENMRNRSFDQSGDFVSQNVLQTIGIQTVRVWSVSQSDSTRSRDGTACCEWNARFVQTRWTQRANIVGHPTQYSKYTFSVSRWVSANLRRGFRQA